MPGFLNHGCAFQGNWKTDSYLILNAPISHHSHNVLKVACELPVRFVESWSPPAPFHRLQSTRVAQNR